MKRERRTKVPNKYKAPPVRVYRAWVLIGGNSPRILPCFGALRAEVEAMDLREHKGESSARSTEVWTEVFEFAQKHNLTGNYNYELSPIANHKLNQ